MIFPWQMQQWDQIWQAKQANRFPHALLLTGIRGLGKAVFAEKLARRILCQKQDSIDFCPTGKGACHACRLVDGKTHQNILWVQPEKAGQAIKVDQIREVNDFIAHSSLQGDYTFAILNPANEMNINAANALLKTLEEPPPKSVLILISDFLQGLPATILSRCQRLTFQAPSHDMALTWLQEQAISSKVDLQLLLKFTNNAPLAALSLLEEETLSYRETLYEGLKQLHGDGDPLKIAAKLANMDMLVFLNLMNSWMLDLLRLSLQINVECLVNSDYAADLHGIFSHFPLKKLILFIDHLQNIRQQIHRGINLNKQLLLEGVMIRYYMLA